MVGRLVFVFLCLVIQVLERATYQSSPELWQRSQTQMCERARDDTGILGEERRELESKGISEVSQAVEKLPIFYFKLGEL